MAKWDTVTRMTKMRELTREEDRVRRTVRAIARYRGLTGVELSRRTGLIPMGVSTRLAGKTAFSITDLWRFAEALDVDPEVLLLDEQDALRWALEHRPTREAGYAQLSLVLGMAVSAAVALTGSRVPSVAPVLQSIAENGRSDDVMSDGLAA